MDKAIIRTLALQKRKALCTEDVRFKSQAICKQVQPFLKGKVALYNAYGKEVDVSYLNFDAIQMYALPKDYPDGSMRFFEVHEHTSFSITSLGIKVPCEGIEVASKDIDVMLIPLVAFDEQCHRLGHGKGYYDRYLVGFKGLCIGIGYECQRFEHIPICKHDITLDMIISEARIYKV